LIGFEISEMLRLGKKFEKCDNCGLWYIRKTRQRQNYCPNFPMPSLSNEANRERVKKCRINQNIASGKLTITEAAKKQGMSIKEFEEWRKDTSRKKNRPYLSGFFHIIFTSVKIGVKLL
jgi:hypothetical protein